MSRTAVKNLVYVLVFIGLLVGVYQAQRVHGNKEITDFEVIVNPLEGDPFLSEDEIVSIVLSTIDSLEEVPQHQVDLNAIERLVEHEPAVENAEAFITANGVLRVAVSLRKVVVRIKPDNNVGYYLDSKGDSMRWVSSFTPRVLTVSGSIGEYGKEAYYDLSPLERHQLFQEQLFAFSSFVIGDEFWSKQLAQLYVNDQGDVEMVTLLGDHNIILGDLEDGQAKLDKMRLYYKQVVRKVGWNKYHTINLKYKDQIVCN